MNDDLQNQQISGKLDNAQIFDCISIVTLSGFRKAERELESLIRPKKQWSLGKGPSIYFWYKCSVFTSRHCSSLDGPDTIARDEGGVVLAFC